MITACFFFFQAEDGIRDGRVTGVQTCALPISWRTTHPIQRDHYGRGIGWVVLQDPEGNEFCILRSDEERAANPMTPQVRSEERRVGKEWRSRGSPDN